MWHMRLPYHVPRGEGFRAAGGAIYLSPFWGIREGESSLSDAVVCYDAAGRMVWERTFAEDTRFVDGEGTDMLALSCGQKLLLMDGAGNAARELTVDAGVIRKYIARADHELALSVNITGTLKTPLFVSRLYYRTEQVLSGYDSRGRLVWRYAIDNTPDYMSRTKTIRGDRRGVEDFLARIEGASAADRDCYNITPDDIFEKTGWQIFKFSGTCESYAWGRRLSAGHRLWRAGARGRCCATWTKTAHTSSCIRTVGLGTAPLPCGLAGPARRARRPLPTMRI